MVSDNAYKKHVVYDFHCFRNTHPFFTLNNQNLSQTWSNDVPSSKFIIPTKMDQSEDKTSDTKTKEFGEVNKSDLKKLRRSKNKERFGPR